MSQSYGTSLFTRNLEITSGNPEAATALIAQNYNGKAANLRALSIKSLLDYINSTNLVSYAHNGNYYIQDLSESESNIIKLIPSYSSDVDSQSSLLRNKSLTRLVDGDEIRFLCRSDSTETAPVQLSITGVTSGFNRIIHKSVQDTSAKNNTSDLHAEIGLQYNSGAQTSINLYGFRTPGVHLNINASGEADVSYDENIWKGTIKLEVNHIGTPNELADHKFYGISFADRYTHGGTEYKCDIVPIRIKYGFSTDESNWNEVSLSLSNGRYGFNISTETLIDGKTIYFKITKVKVVSEVFGVSLSNGSTTISDVYFINLLNPQVLCRKVTEEVVNEFVARVSDEEVSTTEPIIDFDFSKIDYSANTTSVIARPLSTNNLTSFAGSVYSSDDSASFFGGDGRVLNFALGSNGSSVGVKRIKLIYDLTKEAALFISNFYVLSKIGSSSQSNVKFNLKTVKIYGTKSDNSSYSNSYNFLTDGQVSGWIVLDTDSETQAVTYKHKSGDVVTDISGNIPTNVKTCNIEFTYISDSSVNIPSISSMYSGVDKAILRLGDETFEWYSAEDGVISSTKDNSYCVIINPLNSVEHNHVDAGIKFFSGTNDSVSTDELSSIHHITNLGMKVSSGDVSTSEYYSLNKLKFMKLTSDSTSGVPVLVSGSSNVPRRLVLTEAPTAAAIPINKIAGFTEGIELSEGNYTIKLYEPDWEEGSDPTTVTAVAAPEDPIFVINNGLSYRVFKYSSSNSYYILDSEYSFKVSGSNIYLNRTELSTLNLTDSTPAKTLITYPYYNTIKYIIGATSNNRLYTTAGNINYSIGNSGIEVEFNDVIQLTKNSSNVNKIDIDFNEGSTYYFGSNAIGKSTQCYFKYDLTDSSGNITIGEYSELKSTNPLEVLPGSSGYAQLSLSLKFVLKSSGSSYKPMEVNYDGSIVDNTPVPSVLVPNELTNSNYIATDDNLGGLIKLSSAEVVINSEVTRTSNRVKLKLHDSASLNTEYIETPYLVAYTNTKVTMSANVSNRAVAIDPNYAASINDSVSNNVINVPVTSSKLYSNYPVSYALIKVTATNSENTDSTKLIQVCGVNGSPIPYVAYSSSHISENITKISNGGYTLKSLAANAGLPIYKVIDHYTINNLERVVFAVCVMDSIGNNRTTYILYYGMMDPIHGYYHNGKFYRDSSHTNEITPNKSSVYLDISNNKLYQYIVSKYILLKSDYTDSMKLWRAGTLSSASTDTNLVNYVNGELKVGTELISYDNDYLKLLNELNSSSDYSVSSSDFDGSQLNSDKVYKISNALNIARKSTDLYIKSLDTSSGLSSNYNVDSLIIDASHEFVSDIGIGDLLRDQEYSIIYKDGSDKYVYHPELRIPHFELRGEFTKLPIITTETNDETNIVYRLPHYYNKHNNLITIVRKWNSLNNHGLIRIKTHDNVPIYGLCVDDLDNHDMIESGFVPGESQSVIQFRYATMNGSPCWIVVGGCGTWRYKSGYLRSNSSDTSPKIIRDLT